MPTKNKISIHDAKCLFKKLGQVKRPLIEMHTVTLSLAKLATMQVTPPFRKNVYSFSNLTAID